MSRSRERATLCLRFDRFQVGGLPTIVRVGSVGSFSLTGLCISFRFDGTTSYNGHVFLCLLKGLYYGGEEVTGAMVALRYGVSGECYQVLSYCSPSVVGPRFPYLFERRLFYVDRGLFLRGVYTIFGGYSYCGQLSKYVNANVG